MIPIKITEKIFARREANIRKGFQRRLISKNRYIESNRVSLAQIQLIQVPSELF